tara:strand:- start:1217 stop:3487 length:2271 start_codon:yes stop_codon:yes gene_type:complete
MKIETSSAAVDVKTNMQMTTITAELAQDKLHKMWDLLQSPYRDPIASLIREYVSNGFDSHIEAGVNTPVYVALEEDQSGWFWTCEDFGVGLSPDRCENVFMKYLSSTKEETNDQIGAFGMGSKSGLGYTDVVHIRTRFDGTEYTYMLHKTTLAPTLSLVSSCSTSKCNGTQIKVYLKDNWDERNKFEKKTKQQLTYFDNIHYAGSLAHLNEEFVLFKGKNFWHKPSSDFGSVHLVIGKVSYPINWENLGLPEVYLPIALSFDIGDLPVIFTREDIRYTDKAVRKITGKIKEAETELVKLASPKAKEVDDLFLFADLIAGIPTIRFDDTHSLQLTEELSNRVDVSDIVYEPNPYLNSDILTKGVNVHKDNVSELFCRTLANSRKLQNGRNMTCNWYSVNDKYRRVSLSSSNHSSREHPRILMDEASDPRKNRWITQEIGNYCNLFLDNRGKLSLRDYRHILKLKSSGSDKKNWRFQIQWFQDWQDKHFEEFFDYRYSEIEIPEEFEKSARANSQRVIVGTDEIRYKDYRETETNSYGSENNLNVTSDLRKSKVDDLKKVNLVIWSSRSEEEALRCTFRLIRNFSCARNNHSLRVISVAKKDIEIMEILEEENDNIVSLDNWYIAENQILEALVFFEKYGILVEDYNKNEVYRKPTSIPYIDDARAVSIYSDRLPEEFVNHLVKIFYLQEKELKLDDLPALVSWRKAEKRLATMCAELGIPVNYSNHGSPILAHILAPNRPLSRRFKNTKNILLINNL